MLRVAPQDSIFCETIFHFKKVDFLAALYWHSVVGVYLTLSSDVQSMEKLWAQVNKWSFD